MCIALVRVKYRNKETITVDCDTQQALDERLNSLEANDEVMEYRVFLNQGKRVRVSGWEDRA
jgi:hypothetical protein